MKWSLGTLMIVAFATQPVSAQTEIGVDMALQVTSFRSSDAFVDLDDFTTVSFPASHVRLGVFVTPQVSVEPRLGVVYVASGGESATTTQLLVSGYYHFPEMGVRRSAFLRMGMGASVLSSSNVSDTQMLLDAGVGLKLPAHRDLLVRLEAFAGRSFESSESRPATRLGAAFGVSWYSGA